MDIALGVPAISALMPGASHKTIRKLCEIGAIPAFRFGAMWAIRLVKLL